MDKIFDLEILPSAQAEIEEIARLHMALSGLQSARNITDALYDGMEQLTRFPMSGPIVPDEELSIAGYRYLSINKYLMFYRFLGNTIVIYHIVHGATNYPKLFRAWLSE